MTTLKNPATKIFESRAKLMVSGEYLVLKGALSLSLPLVYGQQLTVLESEGEPVIHWKSLYLNNVWFSATFALPCLEILETSSPTVAGTLAGILQAARTLSPGFLETPQGHQVTSLMDFDPGWGMGSSSSLISNIAHWSGCDPFLLNRIVSSGSGYDIACARSSHPLIYRLNSGRPEYRKARFQPRFHRNLWFVYLNRKQETGTSISTTDLSAVSREETEAISSLTLGLEEAEELTEFQLLMRKHEELTGRIIRKEPVGKVHFDDFNGTVKSLGSWGGDFILAASGEPEEYVRNYFNSRNFRTIFRYGDIVLNGDRKDSALFRKTDITQQA